MLYILALWLGTFKTLRQERRPTAMTVRACHWNRMLGIMMNITLRKTSDRHSQAIRVDFAAFAHPAHSLRF